MNDAQYRVFEKLQDEIRFHPGLSPSEIMDVCVALVEYHKGRMKQYER